MNKWVVRVENSGQIGWLDNDGKVTEKRSEARHVATPGSANAIMTRWMNDHIDDEDAFTAIAIANTWVDKMIEEKVVSFNLQENQR